MTIEEKRATRAAYMREYRVLQKARLNARRRRLRTSETLHTEREWKAANREKVLASKKTYNERNAEYIRQWKKDWWQRNKEAIAERRRKHYYKHRKENLARSKAYREAHQEELREKKRLAATTPHGRELNNKRTRRYMVRNPKKNAARIAVSVAVRFKKLPRVSTLSCHYCGGPATEYHHHLGYAKKHHLTVRPSCKLCHEKADHRKN